MQEAVKYSSFVTYREVCEQYPKWIVIGEILEAQADVHKAFLAPLLAKENLRVILCGAGTSAFVGEIAAPALSKKTGKRFEAVATTDIVSNPAHYFSQNVPTLMVSFARSGNSPESLAATQLADQCLDEVYHLVLTCAADGELARGRRAQANSLVVIMPPGSNDEGFAMTSSFTCMLLACLLLFGLGTTKDLTALYTAADYLVTQKQTEIEVLAAKIPKRVVYLGSGSLRGIAHECGLKFLELSAGDHVSFYETALGFRHGPKAVIDQDTQVVVFVSNDPYTRLYDLDIVNELRGNLGTEAVLAVTSAPIDLENTWVWPGVENLDDALVAAVHVLVSQFMGVFTSAALGKNIDNPFPAGDVNRVVKGVNIYPYNQ